MQGVGCTDVLLYFKCPTTKQMRCPVNVYKAYAASQQMRGFRKAAQLPYFFTALRETGHRFRSIVYSPELISVI
jgi:hypothetical protein